jgi:hypothetical protein
VDSRSAWVTRCPGIGDTLFGEGRAARRTAGARGSGPPRSRPGTRGAGAAARWHHEGESDDMRMGRLEHRAFSGGEPRGLCGAMACGAAAVPARVVRLDLMATLVALGDMASQGRRSGTRRWPAGPCAAHPTGCDHSGPETRRHAGAPHRRLRAVADSWQVPQLGWQGDGVQGTPRGMERGGSHMQIEARALQARVPQQQWDAAKVVSYCWRN